MPGVGKARKRFARSRPSRTRPLALYHQRTRRRGVNSVVYWPVRCVVKPFVLLYFRVRRLGREHIPDGAVILASNHRSFLDPFAIGICLRRPVFFVAKRELFRHPLMGWILNCMGAFPVCRGQSDEESVETARQLLAGGHAVVIFPEGTRIRPGSLARPRRGVGRLALETGAPVVPIAVKGSEHARQGWRIRPVKVHVRFGPPLTFPTVERPSPFLAREVTERIWPCVELQWEWLGGLPPLRTAAVVGAGAMGTALAAVLARAGLEVQLGCRTPAQAQGLKAERENAAHLAGVALDPAIAVTSVSRIEFAGVDLVVLAVPCASLPAAMGEVGARIGERSAVLVASKGLVPPLGTLPCAYVSERTRARAVAALAGPAVAHEAVERGASVVVASRDGDLRHQLQDVLASGGFAAEATEDVTGAELAACARNAATLASAAVGPRGAGLAGAAAGRVFAEVHELALSRGAQSETFAGLAGTGDLVAAALSATVAPSRTGEPGGAESLATVPLLGLAFEREGIDAPVTTGLRRMLAGDLTADQWLESVRAAAPRTRSRAA